MHLYLCKSVSCGVEVFSCCFANRSETRTKKFWEGTTKNWRAIWCISTCEANQQNIVELLLLLFCRRVFFVDGHQSKKRNELNGWKKNRQTEKNVCILLTSSRKIYRALQNFTYNYMHCGLAMRVIESYWKKRKKQLIHKPKKEEETRKQRMTQTHNAK